MQVSVRGSYCCRQKSLSSHSKTVQMRKSFWCHHHSTLIFLVLFHVVATASECSCRSVTSSACCQNWTQPASRQNGTASKFVFSLLVFICNCFNNTISDSIVVSDTTPPSFHPISVNLCHCDCSHLQISCRTEDREFAPRLKTAENANIQPNPGLILRAEPTVTNILKVKWQKIPDVWDVDECCWLKAWS